MNDIQKAFEKRLNGINYFANEYHVRKNWFTSGYQTGYENMRKKTMNDIQKAFEKLYTINARWRTDIQQYDSEPTSGKYANFSIGYQSGIDSVKCCGCCEWCKWRDDFETYYCMSDVKEPGNEAVNITEGKDCPEWKART